MRPSEELELCIKYGAGMTAKLPGIDFTINPRNLPDAIPPRPEDVPSFKSVKATMSKRDWTTLRCIRDQQWTAYRKAIAAHVTEQRVVARLRRIQVMVRKLEKGENDVDEN